MLQPLPVDEVKLEFQKKNHKAKACRIREPERFPEQANTLDKDCPPLRKILRHHGQQKSTVRMMATDKDRGMISWKKAC